MIVAVLPRAHELAELAVVGLEAFMRHPLIDCSPASEAASSSVVHERFARLGGELITGEYASTVLGMVALVAAGDAPLPAPSPAPHFSFRPITARIPTIASNGGI